MKTKIKELLSEVEAFKAEGKDQLEDFRISRKFCDWRLRE